ncbi:MAG TPA: glycosyltransferase [Candidatus Acidoferrales bacterium]|nr:glycosyltransferase [Candidatus Acidoferrales bacterium]
MSTATSIGSPEISVVICTHQPRPEYLRRTLAALQTQTLPKAQWELLLVDNASQPAVAKDHDVSWHPLGRQLVEHTLGLTPARLRGIAEARGQWLVFVDDDNLLAADYLANVMAIAAAEPRLAVLGAGTLRPEFEIPPPRELNDLLPLLALRQVKSPQRGGDPKQTDALPCGAGLCVHREIARQFSQLIGQVQSGVVLGRKGGELFSHEDDLFSWAAAAKGMEFGVFPELHITHLISAGRLNQAYFLRLIYFHTFSHWILQFLLAGETPRRIGWLRTLRLAPHALRRGIFSARCQWQWALGEDRAARFIVENSLSPLAKPRENPAPPVAHQSR